MKLNLIPLIVIGAIGAGVWWYLRQPVDTFTKDVYFGGEIWPGTMVKHYRNGTEIATLSDGTRVIWNGTEWTFF